MRMSLTHAVSLAPRAGYSPVVRPPGTARSFKITIFFSSFSPLACFNKDAGTRWT